MTTGRKASAPASSPVFQLRTRLGFTQVEFAALWGVHTMTVSKWERGLGKPDPWRDAMLSIVRQATGVDDVRDVFHRHGAAYAFAYLLSIVRLSPYAPDGFPGPRT